MMAGAVSVLNEAGCALVGGHTGEGSELALGFAVNGLIDERLAGMTTKGGLRPGDALILTKPVGTGTLFAAHARPRRASSARGRWIDAALDAMQVSNRDAARRLREHGAAACTDLTGFGLLGHLVEMTRPSGVDAELDLNALPLLDGAAECARPASSARCSRPTCACAAPCATRKKRWRTPPTRCCSTRRPPAACSPACRRSGRRLPRRAAPPATPRRPHRPGAAAGRGAGADRLVV
jgi:selenium donor protein